MAGLAVEADPQRWCSSPYFRQSYKTLESNGQYLPDPQVPTPGTSWAGYLFEEFEWQVGPLQVCRFFNILNIDYRVLPEHIRLEYSLRRPLQGKVWFSRTPLGVDVDSGYLDATPTGAGAAFDIVKRIRFIELTSGSVTRTAGGLSSRFLNQCAGAALHHWLGQAVAPWLKAG